MHSVRAKFYPIVKIACLTVTRLQLVVMLHITCKCKESMEVVNTFIGIATVAVCIYMDILQERRCALWEFLNFLQEHLQLHVTRVSRGREDEVRTTISPPGPA